MKDKTIIKEGVWYNSKMAKRKVRITLRYNQSVEEHFDVWYKTIRGPFSAYGGHSSSEYETMNMIEKITGQKVQWHIAVQQAV